eukprot:scaffold43974_cov54-Attheya_sp.AAC.1
MEMQTICHGVAAASGKLGALTASIMFNYVNNDLDMFLLSGYASFVAVVITFWMIPETTGLDLYENDVKWRLILAGRKADYAGDANKPAFFSVYKRNKRLCCHKAEHHDGWMAAFGCARWTRLQIVDASGGWNG